MKSHAELDSLVDANRHDPNCWSRGISDLYTIESTKNRRWISDERAMIHNVRSYASDGATMMAPGCAITEEATSSFIKFEVSGSMGGRPDMGEVSGAAVTS